MQLPDETITFNYQGLLTQARADEEWKPLQELQQQHFLENYVEEKKYPKATFTGRFIEDIPFTVPGTYSVRAKGNLEIHGVIKERIIRGTLTITKESARVQSSFFVPVADHGIIIPKIVMQKIAEQIAVDIDVEFRVPAKS